MKIFKLFVIDARMHTRIESESILALPNIEMSIMTKATQALASCCEPPRPYT